MNTSHLLLLMFGSFWGAASVRDTKGGPWSARDSASVRPEVDAALQHMTRLYEKYNRDHRLKEGNTVRSVRAIQDSPDHRTVYRLNLTALQDSEVVLSAAFHFLLERRPHQRGEDAWFCKRFQGQGCRSPAVHPPSSISLIFRSVSSGSEVGSGSTGSLIGNVTFHPHRRGVWQMKDVTQVIQEARDKGHRLASVELNLGQRFHKKAENTLPAGSLPYLLVYANDQALDEPNSVAASLQRYDPSSEGEEPTHSSQLPHGRNSSPEWKGRVRRQATVPPDPIENNELPQVDYRPDGYRKDDLWESTWYLTPKTKSGGREGNWRGQDEEGAEGGRGRADIEEQLILQEERRSHHGQRTQGRTRTSSDGRKHERRHGGKDGKKSRGRSNAQSSVLNFDEQTMRSARRRQWNGGQNRGCSRRNLRVDFADIGWSEWIIAPKAFEAYYCAGTCEFPMPKVARPSNHATIQSIVRAVGIIPGIPEPCCIPEKMSPLAVLYQDESSNPVLKVYPNMSIQSCSCR